MWLGLGATGEGGLPESGCHAFPPTPRHPRLPVKPIPVGLGGRLGKLLAAVARRSFLCNEANRAHVQHSDNPRSSLNTEVNMEGAGNRASPALPAWRHRMRVQGNSWALCLLTDDRGQEQHKETPGEEEVPPQTDRGKQRMRKRNAVHKEKPSRGKCDCRSFEMAQKGKAEKHQQGLPVTCP